MKKAILLAPFVILFVLVVSLQAAESVGLTSVKAIPVDERWQLFVDDYVIARSTGLSRLLQHPQPRGVVIPADQPWETAGVETLYGTPVGRREDGTFYAFYRAMWWDPGSVTNMPNGMKQDRAHQMREGRVGTERSVASRGSRIPAINTPMIVKLIGPCRRCGLAMRIGSMFL